MTMEVGYVKSVKGPIVYLDGLPSVKIGDLVEGQAALGFVSALLPEKVEVMLIRTDDVKPGQSFTPTGKTLSLPAGDFLLGRAIDPLGNPIDAGPPIPKENVTQISLEPESLGVANREFIRQQFETGITLVDTVAPLGRGQRELVMGDARSGKSGFIVDIIINQKNKNVICVYGCIGKPAMDVHDLIAALKRNDALKHTIFVASFSGDSPPLIYLSPKAALAIAAYFQQQGKDVLLILDDMGVHAKIYREISLLGGRTPGREAYPGDIFYEHAHLLERAGCFNSTAGAGSITALPMVELGLTDFTGYISTNLMSMTDGHFLFDASLYAQGQRPAVDLLLSVSRVGQQTQKQVQVELGFKIKQILTESQRLVSLTSFSSELPAETRRLLTQKNMIMELLRQAQSVYISLAEQTILMALPFCEFLKSKDEKFLLAFKDIFINCLRTNEKIKAVVDQVLDLPGVDELVKKVDEVGPEFLAAVGKIKPNVPTGSVVPEAVSTKQPTQNDQ
jgi:F-type H+-transporting ATPase subunit alpha